MTYPMAIAVKKNATASYPTTSLYLYIQNGHPSLKNITNIAIRELGKSLKWSLVFISVYDYLSSVLCENSSKATKAAVM